MTHRFKGDAAQELLNTVKYYQGKRAGLGKEFLAEINHAITTIKQAPMRWAEIDQAVRRYRLDRFPYHLYYRVDGDAVVIIAVAHLHRRPGYWRDRLND